MPSPTFRDCSVGIGSKKLPVIHVRHASVEPFSPLRPDTPGFAFKEELAPLPDEPVFEKNVNSAFIGTGLHAHLLSRAIQKLTIVGFTTDHCISTSTRMASNLGFSVKLIGDATATFDRTGIDGRRITADEIHTVNLASLDGEFCSVVSTISIAREK